MAIGFAPIFVRLSDLGPLATAFWRMLLASFILFCYLVITQKKEITELFAREKIKQVYFAGIVLAFDLAIWHFSIMYTTISNATLLCNISPAFLFLYDAIYQKVNYPIKLWMLLVIAIISIGLFVHPNMHYTKQIILGDVFAISAAFFVAIYNVTIRSSRNSFSTLHVMFISSLTSSIVLFILTLFAKEPLFPATLHGWTIVVLLAIICHIVGQGLIANSLKYLSASFTSLVLIIQPIVAAVIAWILFSERITFIQICAAFMVIFCIIYLSQFQHEQ